MRTNYVEGNCPICGAKTKEACNMWLYGSPIRNCQSCKSEYLDKRWREVAIDGFDPRSMNRSLYFKCTIGFLIFTVICVLILVLMINGRGYYPTKLLGCIFIGALGTILCGFLYLRIKLGFEAKNNEKFMEDSQQRLADRIYIQKLTDYGYDIPEEYMK